MPELRKEPVSGRWVIIATERALRPSDFIAVPPPTIKGNFCPFCEGNEDKTPPEIMAYRERDTRPNTRGWRVRVVPNKFPALVIEGGLNKRGDGIYDIMNGIGAHEVIIECPQHKISLTSLPPAHVQEIIWTYRDRLVDLKKDKRLIYGMLFKNVGAVAGASLEHTHTQLIVTPIVPLVVASEMEGSMAFYKYRGRCLFCDMINQELSNGSRMVLEGEHFVTFAPYAARFPFELWILPKNHSSHFENIQRSEVEELAETLRAALCKLEGALEQPPYNFIIHTSPFDQPELAHYHWHIEIIPRLTRVAGFEWGTGFYINPVPPENAAEYLKKVEVPPC
ncbi:MAG TPA: galactose-1-phosphate uridylyltransferase [Candidatus Hypogeohydataceae bacterium YC38]|jgi:UDPglucose--hexose-1-phosphate uridylyltransferase|nr:galactose-1-phosphate uridylyltransferase [Candidatus Brocadiales bacterium]